MPDYKNDRFARKPFNKGGNRFGGQMQKFKVDCSKCGDLCEVPFRPNGKKPVYCSNCFVKDSGDAPRGRREFSPRPSFERPQREDRGMGELKAELQGINEKLERLLRSMEVSRAVQSAVASEKPAAAAKKAKAAVKKRAAKKK